jgi:hypothetical protein
MTDPGGAMRKLIVLLLVFCLFIPVATVQAQNQALRFYYAGPDGGVLTALALDKQAVRVEDPAQADVFVLNGIIPGEDGVVIRDQVEKGAGLVLILGPEVNAEEVSGLLGVQVTMEKKEDALSLVPLEGSSESLLTEILWTSAPQVRERFSLSGGNLSALVKGFEDGSLVLGTTSLGTGRVYVLSAFLDEVNPEFQQWPYFNYLVYHLTSKAGGQEPASFAEYGASPVPHRTDQIVLVVLMGLILVTAVAAFWLVRRYSLAHPEALDAIVLNKKEFVAKEAHTAWEEIGFHRPLGGFFVMLFLGLLLFVPIIIYQNLVLPVFILPSAQAIGMWGRVTQFFGVVWTFFDMGTSVAFVKYLSEYRVHDPRKGIMFGQVFVWWQALSGAVQVAMVVILAGTVMPRTAYAIYAWSVIVHTFTRSLGFTVSCAMP